MKPKMKFTEKIERDDYGVKMTAMLNGYAAFSVRYDKTRGYWLTICSPVDYDIYRFVTNQGIAETDILTGAEDDAIILFQNAKAKITG